MATDEISYKDLSIKQLDNLKSIYIEKRLSSMSQDEIKEFVRVSISDQIKGTVGNQEEKEAWEEMKDFFEDYFPVIIKEIIQVDDPLKEESSSEKKDLEKRLELLEQRKKEKSNINEDMW